MNQTLSLERENEFKVFFWAFVPKEDQFNTNVAREMCLAFDKICKNSAHSGSITIVKKEQFQKVKWFIFFGFG